MVYMSPAKMAELTLSAGDHAELTGKRRRATICAVQADDDLQDNMIRMNEDVRKNLLVKAGDVVRVKPQLDIENCESVVVLPIADTVQDLDDDLESYLDDYFSNAYRAVHVANTFSLPIGDRTVEFRVMRTEPQRFCIVADRTDINYEGDPVNRDTFEGLDIGYEDIGGLKGQLAQIKELVELPLRHPSLHKTIGFKPPRGILLHGPPGTGNFHKNSTIHVKKY